MKKTEQLKVCERAFLRLESLLQGRDWDRYIKQITEEERDHRRFSWAPSLKNGITVGAAVRLFAVQTLLKRLHSNSEKAWPKCWDYTFTRSSIFIACSLAKANYLKLSEMFPEADRRLLFSLDYAALNEDPRFSKGEPALQGVDL